MCGPVLWKSSLPSQHPVQGPGRRQTQPERITALGSLGGSGALLMYSQPWDPVGVLWSSLVECGPEKESRQTSLKAHLRCLMKAWKIKGMMHSQELESANTGRL